MKLKKIMSLLGMTLDILTLTISCHENNKAPKIPSSCCHATGKFSICKTL